ncbi:MAG: dienelactone hydrolase family protein [Firmicutes bacterium]|nr:dienelactone hydrolase family protein [Bacillota bacterium]
MRWEIDERVDGERLVGHLAVPAAASGRRPAVLVWPAIHGLNPYVKAVADELAQAGWVAFSVDYYDGAGAPPLRDAGEVATAVASLSDPGVLRKGKAALQYLRSRPEVDGERLAALGFCIGGMYAFQMGCEPVGLKAAVDFYGMIRYDRLTAEKPLHPIDRVSELRCPLLAHFGTEDHLLPPEMVDAFYQALASQRPVFEFYRYPGAGHAFHDWTRPGFRPVAAKEAWSRTLTFLSWYLAQER